MAASSHSRVSMSMEIRASGSLAAPTSKSQLRARRAISTPRAAATATIRRPTIADTSSTGGDAMAYVLGTLARNVNRSGVLSHCDQRREIREFSAKGATSPMCSARLSTLAPMLVVLCVAGPGQAQPNPTPTESRTRFHADFEVDPTAYILDGYSLHAGIGWKRVRVDLGAFAMSL